MAAAKIRLCSHCKTQGHDIRKCPIIELEIEEAEKEKALQKEMEIAALEKERDNFVSQTIQEQLLQLFDMLKEFKTDIKTIKTDIKTIKKDFETLESDFDSFYFEIKETPRDKYY